jgi:hypothetical protein
MFLWRENSGAFHAEVVVLNHPLCRGHSPQHGDSRLAKNVLDNGFPQARRVVFEVQLVRFLVEVKFLQTVGVREVPESPEILRLERALKLIRNRHESHARIIAAAGSVGSSFTNSGLC